MLLSRDAPHYLAYLLRWWQAAGADGLADQVWRFSLEDPSTGERRGFASFEALLVFLRAELAAPRARAAADDDPGGHGAGDGP